MMRAYEELTTAALEAYNLLADVRHQWNGRHTQDGQRLLANLRDALAVATKTDAEQLQDNARHHLCAT